MIILSLILSIVALLLNSIVFVTADDPRREILAFVGILISGFALGGNLDAIGLLSL